MSEDYDFVFWIDADAAFYDQERRIEDVLDLEVGGLVREIINSLKRHSSWH